MYVWQLYFCCCLMYRRIHFWVIIAFYCFSAFSFFFYFSRVTWQFTPASFPLSYDNYRAGGHILSPHFIGLLSSLLHIQSKVLSALFHISNLTDAHDLVIVASLGFKLLCLGKQFPVVPSEPETAFLLLSSTKKK